MVPFFVLISQLLEKKTKNLITEQECPFKNGINLSNFPEFIRLLETAVNDLSNSNNFCF